MVEFPQLTCEMNIPGSLAPNGILEWSMPPIILKPSEPVALLNVTSCKMIEQLKTVL